MDFFLNGIGRYTPPLNGQSMCSKKLSGKGGYPPPLNVFERFPKFPLFAYQQILIQRLSFPMAQWNRTLTHYYYVLSGCFFVLIPQVHLLLQTKLFTCPHLTTKAVYWDETLVQKMRYFIHLTLFNLLILNLFLLHWTYFYLLFLFYLFVSPSSCTFE